LGTLLINVNNHANESRLPSQFARHTSGRGAKWRAVSNGSDQLRKRIATPAGEIRERIDLEIRDLGSKAEAVRDRVRAVEAAGASNWGHLKNAVDEGIKQLGQGIDEALEKLRKTGSGDR
jgi:hypothetical protein